MTKHSYTEPGVRKISLLLNGGCMIEQVSNSPEIKEDDDPTMPPDIFDEY